MTSENLFSLQGRKILVTGAAGYLGTALCRYLVADGAIVLASDLAGAGLDSLNREFEQQRGHFFSFAGDLANDRERTDLVANVSAVTDGLDGVVFAAAFVGSADLEGWAVDFADQSVETWRKALELNLTAPFHLTQQLLPMLSQADMPAIVNVASIYGILGPDWSLYEGLDMSNPAAYAASKGGLIQLTRWLASTLAPTVRVNAVSPGGIFRQQPEEFVERYSAKAPMGRMAHESDVVPTIAYLLSGASGYITGENIVIDGGISLS